MTTPVSDAIVTYAVGAGGRIDVLPARYLDVVADAVTRTHPRSLPYVVAKLLASGRYRRSIHPELREASVASFVERHRIDQRRWRAERRRRAAETQSDAQPDTMT